ncbi:lysophospholipase [Mycena olivaceomarginata]|nr:lysophospholipase [Mycena olivaceomarginata]
MLASATTFVLLVLSGLGPASSASIGPSLQRCPADFQLVRRGQTISASEAHYIKQKREKVLPGAFKTYLHSVKGTGVQLPKYVEQILGSEAQLPTVGISTSGGGYRAAIFGAGVLNALDARNSSAVKKGTGGLLQAATHLAGLSGGAWLVTSLAQANFPTIQHLIFGDGKAHDFSGWNPSVDLWTASADPAEQAVFVQEVLQEIAVKAKHFPVSVGDAWGRSLARHFTNGTTPATLLANTSHGAGILFSDLVNLPTFTSHEHPFPILVADIVSKHINGTIFPGGNAIPLNSPIFEFNLFEMGCYDDVLAAHTPTKHLGTTNHSVCVTGFDEAMFLAGTSSNLWNELNITSDILAAATANFSALVNATYPQSPLLRLDTSNYPNPFRGVAPATFSDAGETILSLVDGGEDGQVTPLQPMLVEGRAIDVIVAIDAVNDANGFAAGASLIATQERMQLFPRGLAPFPAVPTSLAVFAAANLTARPTFFGCTPPPHAASAHAKPPPGPLLVYIANGAPPRDGAAPLTNTSTGQFVYAPDELRGMLAQSFDAATQGAVVGGALEDREWGACLACAVVDRARAREGVERSGVCVGCFARYCWEE